MLRPSRIRGRAMTAMTAENGPVAASRSGRERVSFFGVPVDTLPLDRTIALAEAAMAEKRLTRHTALNVAKLVNLRTDKELADDVATSDIVGIDGKGIALGIRLFGGGSHDRVAGVDLFIELLKHCAATGRRPFILGARQDVLERAIAEARRLFPTLEFAGWRNGYFSQDEAGDVVASIRQSKADCLFVAMPTPHKERFLNLYAGDLGVPFIMGVGGSVDVLAGHVSRAPVWMQNAGLEWFHRLLKEPRKMFWRYARTNFAYALLLARAAVTRRNPLRPA